MADRTVRLGTSSTLKSFIANVIDESVKSALHQRALQEKEKQDASVASSGGDANSSGGNSGNFLGMDDEDGESEDTSSKTMDDETEKLKQGDIKAKDIVEKLNSIRSGRSFKDSGVSGAMEEYIDSLSKAEKVALLAFLKGIAQIVTGEIPAKQADEPSDHPSDVKMDKENSPKVIHKKPNVIKAAGKPSGSGGQAPQEDTSSPAPITPKRR